ncbi:MAG: hypothetical protein Q9226_003230 [Calogaya cf. arnoldii]
MTAALLLIDLQNDFLSPTGALSHANFLAENPNLQSNISAAISHFRAQNRPIIWIRSQYPRTKLPPIWPPRPLGLRYANVPILDERLASSHYGHMNIMCAPGSYGAELYPDFEKLKEDDDAVFVKQYYSAFTHTGLATYLQSKDIVTVVIAGVSANHCVLAAATDAFFHELDVFVLSACVGASSENLHRLAIEKIASHYGRVVDAVSKIPTAASDTEIPGTLQANISNDRKLFYVNGSIPSWRVMMMLSEYNIPYTPIRLKVMSKPKETRSAAFARINARCKTPTLVDGNITITESMAILQYIERKYALPPVAPVAQQGQGGEEEK